MATNALVMAGHIRTFREISDQLVAFKELNNLDAYAFIWDEGNDEEIENVVQTLKPTMWIARKNELVVQEFLNAELRVHQNNPKNLITPDNVSAMLSMHYARRQAFELINREYDNIIFTRFDTHIYPFRLNGIIEKSPDTVITPTNEQYGMVSDIFAIVPWKHADNYFFYNRVEDILSRRFDDKLKEWLLKEKFLWENRERDVRLHDENRYCPHLLCMRNFFETNTPYIVVDLPVYIKR